METIGIDEIKIKGYTFFKETKQTMKLKEKSWSAGNRTVTKDGVWKIYRKMIALESVANDRIGVSYSWKFFKWIGIKGSEIHLGEKKFVKKWLIQLKALFILFLLKIIIKN